MKIQENSENAISTMAAIPAAVALPMKNELWMQNWHFFASLADMRFGGQSNGPMGPIRPWIVPGIPWKHPIQKKLLKIAMYAAAIAILYLGYLYFSGETADSVLGGFQNVKDDVKSGIEESFDKVIKKDN